MTAINNEFVQRVAAWQGNDQGPGPRRITLFPTNICNIKCRHCWQRWGEYDKTFKSELSDERLMALVEEAAELGVEEWYFVGGGEPMARGKLLMAMCERIRELGMNGAIHTNGTLFRPGMLERLVDIGWCSIRVSLDGPNEEINDYIRTAGFAKAIANVRKLSELKRQAGATAPEIAFCATVNNMIWDKIVDFVELAHSLGPDVDVQLAGLIVESEGSAELEMSPEQVQAFPDKVHEGIARARELGVRTNFPQYLEKELVLDTAAMQMNADVPVLVEPTGKIHDAMCFEPWLSASIQPDGRLGPCCAFAGEALSIKDQTLGEVWYGAYMQQVRAGMTNGDPPYYCKRCPSNLYVHKEHYRNIIRKGLLWSQMNAADRLAYLTGRTANSLREVGLKGTMDRSLNWLRLRKGSKVG